MDLKKRFAIEWILLLVSFGIAHLVFLLGVALGKIDLGDYDLSDEGFWNITIISYLVTVAVRLSIWAYKELNNN